MIILRLKHHIKIEKPQRFKHAEKKRKKEKLHPNMIMINKQKRLVQDISCNTSIVWWYNLCITNKHSICLTKLTPIQGSSNSNSSRLAHTQPNYIIALSYTLELKSIWTVDTCQNSRRSCYTFQCKKIIILGFLQAYSCIMPLPTSSSCVLTVLHISRPKQPTTVLLFCIEAVTRRKLLK